MRIINYNDPLIDNSSEMYCPMKNLMIKCCFPILPNLPLEYYESFNDKHLLIKEISNVLKEKSPFKDKLFEVEFFKIEENELTKDKKAEMERFLKTELFSYDFLSIEFIIKSISIENLKITSSSGNVVNGTDGLNIFFLDLMCDYFGKLTYELLFLSQISRPGSLKLLPGIVYVYNAPFRKIAKIPSTRNIFSAYYKYKYSSIDSLDFRLYYKWLKSNDITFSFPQSNSYQKSIVNLTYLENPNRPMINLVHQLRTLEMLYTSGVNQIANQLHEKIQIFLGEMPTHKKTIKKMYDIRSRFLHGSIDVYPKHYYEEEVLYDDYLAICDTVDFSRLLIISTLQRMYKMNLIDIEYVTLLKQ